MSWQPAEKAICDEATGCEPVELTISPREHDLGGLPVRRVLPVREKRMLGPFIFFDHVGPVTLPPEQSVDVRPHPHIGLSTLTWLFDGRIMHRDSLGYAQEIIPGEVNWMTAGSGIVHSERSPEDQQGQPKSLFGLQIWMALPAEHEETDPAFQHVAADQLPAVEDGGLKAKVIAGQAWGCRSPVNVFSDTLYVDVALDAGAALPLGPEHEERALYPISGDIDIGGETFQPGAMLVLKPGTDVTIRAVTEARLVVIGGARMDGPRHIWWNFVSSRKERIEQAKADWREGRFPKVPGDDAFIPLPDG